MLRLLCLAVLILPNLTASAEEPKKEVWVPIFNG